MAVRAIQVDSFSQFHVVQEGVERNEVGERDASAALPSRCCLREDYSQTFFNASVGVNS